MRTSRTQIYIILWHTLTHTDTLLHIATETLTVGVGAVLQSSTAEARSRQCSGWSMAGWWVDQLTEVPGVHTWPPRSQGSYTSSCNPITPSLPPSPTLLPAPWTTSEDGLWISRSSHPHEEPFNIFFIRTLLLLDISCHSLSKISQRKQTELYTVKVGLSHTASLLVTT